MRGAGLRLNNDVRRVWLCAACGVERKVGAEVTTVRCQCAGRPAMKLIEPMRRERPFKELSSPYLEFVFEPGELAPPRSSVEEQQLPPVDDLPLDAETSAAIESEVNEGGPSTSEGDRPRANPSQRPPRHHDRRGDRGPAPARGPQARKESGPRSDPPPRQNSPLRRDPPPPQDSPRDDESRSEEGSPVVDSETSVTPEKTRRNRRPRRRNDRQAEAGLPPVDNSGFGEGVPEIQPPE